MTDPSLQLRISAALATLRESVAPQDVWLVDTLEDYIVQERQTANLALALLRAPAGPDLGGYELGDPKAWYLRERGQ